VAKSIAGTFILLAVSVIPPLLKILVLIGSPRSKKSLSSSSSAASASA